MTDPVGRSRARQVAMLAATVLAILAPSPAGRGQAPAPAAPIAGRVIDERGEPVAGASVRLYRRWSHRDDHDEQVEEVRAGADGRFQLATTPFPPGPTDSGYGPASTLVADHPGFAVGWRTIVRGTSFLGEVRLLAATADRTVRVVDETGQPLAGATVAATTLDDPAPPSAWRREYLSLTPIDGPLTATTDAAGRARFRNLPGGQASFEARKPGYAANICLRRDLIRLNPAATLEGTITGPDGRPLPGITVHLKAGMFFFFRDARTDARGHYRFPPLPARGWDRSEIWETIPTADGHYKLWIEGPEVAINTRPLTLEPGERRVMDLEARRAGVIRVAVREEGTGRPVAGVAVAGTDKETGSSGRFGATTDAQGVARIYATPASISLSLAGPPEGTFLDQNALYRSPHARWAGYFVGGDLDVALTLPRIIGRLGPVVVRCANPDGTPASTALLYARTAPSDPALDLGSFLTRRGEPVGEFALDRVPLGHPLTLYATTDDGKLGAWRLVPIPAAGPPGPIRLDLRPTVTAEFTLRDEDGKPYPHCEASISTSIRYGDNGPSGSRTAQSDGRGRIRLDGVIPGLGYHIVAFGPPRPSARPAPATGLDQPAVDIDLILAPE